ncbi:MAG: FecR domain-containing protein [Tannerella sp.]|jgi:ferric-dicitrate binding protein FerR (iron transport regulator)|nr:FecR domain-containing protein [Tannerella sp.]
MEQLLHSYFQDQLSIEKRAELLREVASDASLRQLFVEMKNLYALAMLSDQATDPDKSRESYHLFMRKNRRKRFIRLGLKYSGYAAAIISLILSTYWITLNSVQDDLDGRMQSLYVPAGQRLRFVLQDGTSVWLNAHSTLTYPTHFGKKERKVAIIGEAFFDVAKDTDRPFIVSSQGVSMEVLGTVFNVYSYPEAGYMQTSLLEGELKVYHENEESEGILLHPNQQITIDEREMLVDTITNSAHFLWTEGIYSFHNEPLINIIHKLELYFDIKIIVKDPTINTWEYTGKFRQRDGIDEILRIINKIHEFKIERDEESNTIVLSN